MAVLTMLTLNPLFYEFSAAAFYALLYLFLQKWIFCNPAALKNEKLAAKIPLFLLLTGLSLLLVKSLLSLPIEGAPNDINSFKSWAADVYKLGFTDFYSGKVWVDYPPGYMYVLWVVGAIQHLFGLNFASNSYLLLVKLPAILADLATASLIFLWSRKRMPQLAAGGLGLLYLLNPAMIYTSSVWGQVDAILGLILLLFIYFASCNASPRRLGIAGVLYACAVLVKPQALICAPIVLFMMLRTQSLKQSLKLLAVITGTFILLLIPFSLYKEPFWIFKLYGSTLSSYPYASLNAFNFYTLFNSNFANETANVLFMPATWWGYLFIACITLYAWLLFFKSKQEYSLCYIAFFLIVATFIFSTKMHERYLLPAISLAFLSYILLRDRRVLHLAVALSICTFLNIASVLSHVLETGDWFSQNPFMMFSLSLIQVLLCGYTAWLGWDILVKGHILEFKQLAKSQPVKDLLIISEEPQQQLQRRDWMMLGILILTYSAIAFYNLGSTKGPQTYWEPEKAGESFVVEFDEMKPIERIFYALGLGEGSYTLLFSKDGIKFDNPLTIAHASIWESLGWKAVQKGVIREARFVKIVAETGHLMLNEITFYPQGSREPIKIQKITPIHLSSLDKGHPENVFDEPDPSVQPGTFYNGTYFDEIYFPRSAYENILGQYAHENTHPPLGKLIIALGVSIFGMTPFGWRFMGTFFGIAMIPLMYYFGLSLFKKREYALITALLFTFDFMHFTQTRIATIDTFALFFILLSYLFLFKFMQSNVYASSTIFSGLNNLAWAGIFAGLGMASKWTALWATVGIEVLFLLIVLDKCLQYRRAKAANKIELQARQITFKSSFLKTMAGAALFLIVVPLFIYLLAWIPFMRVPPGHGIGDVLQAQIAMYRYHAELKATHPYSSVWYEWPLMIKPMLYYFMQADTENHTARIVAMGNPAIWWLGLPAILATAVMGYKKRDKVAAFIVIGFAFQYFPWAILARKLVFIYHFFVSVPFLVFAIVYQLRYLTETVAWFKPLRTAYVSLVILLFFLFYPVISGFAVSNHYTAYLKWLPQWPI